jgi:5-methylcytosine-specific restriction endonuclease McrA
MDFNSAEIFEMAYDRFGNFFGDSPDDIVAQKCSDCGKVQYLHEFHSDSSRKHGYDVRCTLCKKSDRYVEIKKKWARVNKEKVKLAYHRRLARKKSLPDNLTTEQVTHMLEHFGGCALTGSVDLHLDHVIPLAAGRGGTVVENMIPLRSDLNISKNSRNIFEWFNKFKDAHGLKRDKFDELIEYLANLNGMTTEDYRDYVYWCHENPREVVS